MLAKPQCFLLFLPKGNNREKARHFYPKIAEAFRKEKLLLTPYGSNVLSSCNVDNGRVWTGKRYDKKRRASEDVPATGVKCIAEHI